MRRAERCKVEGSDWGGEVEESGGGGGGAEVKGSGGEGWQRETHWSV